MRMAVELFRMLSEANVKATRSTALRPLVVVFISLIIATLAGAREKLTGWIVVSMGIAAALAFLALLVAYFYLLVKDRDCLRSEKYTLTKLAIEHGLLGDDVVGTFKSVDNGGTKVLDSSDSEPGLLE